MMYDKIKANLILNIHKVWPGPVSLHNTDHIFIVTFLEKNVYMYKQVYNILTVLQMNSMVNYWTYTLYTCKFRGNHYSLHHFSESAHLQFVFNQHA